MEPVEYVLSDADLDHVRAELRRNAQLFDRPHAYISGVEDAVAALIARSRDPESALIEVPDLDAETRRSRMI